MIARRMRQLGAAAWITLAACVMASSPALAQNIGGGGGAPQKTQQQPAGAGAGQSRRPPVPQRPDKPSVLLYYLVIAVLTGATVTIGILPSKRGHED